MMVVCNSVASGDVEQIVPKSHKVNLAGVADGLLIGVRRGSSQGTQKQAGNPGAGREPEEGHIGQSRG